MSKKNNNTKTVVFIDSGIGGLPYCVDFHKKNPDEEVCYIADTKNFPYGPRAKDELAAILTALTEKLLITVNPKIIVLACNTATIAALPLLRTRFPQIPFVGTVPALKPAAKISNKRKIGVLGTKRTIEEIHSLHLIDETCEIIGVAAPELVEFVERQFYKADKSSKQKIVKKYVDIFRREGVDSLVLGCTHFLFLLDEFHEEALNPGFGLNIEVFDSLEGITKRIEYLLDENDGLLRRDKNRPAEHRLLLTSEGFTSETFTGETFTCESQDSFWRERANTLGFKLGLLNEYE